MEDKTASHAQANAQPTAAEAYAAKAKDIARLIDVLQMELDKHETLTKGDSKNRGRVGDLEKVRQDLIETVSFLSGMERRRIEEFLAE